MNQDFQSNIFNIPSNYHFFESFIKWLCSKFGDQVLEVKILFPNRRACREFENIFINKFGKDLMPKVEAIADISYHDFLDSFPKEKINSTINEISQIKHLEGLDYLFFLSSEIIKTQVFGENISFSQALSIATQLKNLFDDIERQEIDLNLLYTIDDSDLALHRQFTLDFLKKFYLRIKNSIFRDDIFSNVAHQNFVISKFISAIESCGLKSPLIIAGTTGSVNYSKKLLKAVAADKNGHVLLYGLHESLAESASETSPQFILNELLKFIKDSVDKKNIIEVSYEEFKICAKSRLDFLAYSMLPSLETYKWQAVEKRMNQQNIANDFAKNFFYLQANNEVEEARLIAVVVAEAVFNNQKIAIIANDHKFVDLIKLELNNFSLNFNDARSLDLLSSKLINLILLLLELNENNFDSSLLLALLKHDYSSYFCDKNLSIFEIEILRQARTVAGLEGIEKKISQAENKELKIFFESFLQNLKALDDLIGEVDLSVYFQTIISVIEKLSKKNIDDLISLEPCAEELFKLFEKLKLQAGYKINSKDALRFFAHLFSQVSYFEKSQTDACVQIVSPIEARLLNFDVLVLTSLNQGDFPQNEGENWLGKKIRADLQIDLSAKKYGQNAYDFCNYLSNEKVVLTRCKSKNGILSIASPFILRLEILCKKLAIKLNDGAEYFALLNKLDNESEISVEASKILSPKPPLEYRPQKISITEIAKLFSNPYEIYVKKILQLKELNKLDYEPEAREFGSFVHKALEEFVKNKEDKLFLSQAKKIFVEFFINEEAKLIWWPRFENMFKNFIEQNNNLQAKDNYLEVPVKLMINNVLISGKIDRISSDKEGFIKIFDYKTGQIPAIKDVFLGLQPQLTIYALMLCCGLIEDKNLQKLTPEKITSLNYWKLSATGEGEIKSIIKTAEELAAVVAAAKIGIENLLQYFAEEKNGYLLKEILESRAEYWHISRGDIILLK